MDFLRFKDRFRFDVLGSANVGKSSLIRAFRLSNPYRTLSELLDIKIRESRTHPVFASWPFRHPIAFDPKFVKSNGFVVVCDSERKDTVVDAAVFVREIRSVQPDAPVVVTGLRKNTEEGEENDGRSKVTEMIGNDPNVILVDLAYPHIAPHFAFAHCAIIAMKKRSGHAWLTKLQYPACFWADDWLFLMIEYEVGKLDVDACLKCALHGLNRSLQHKASAQVLEKFNVMIQLLLQKDANVQTIGPLVSDYPFAVATTLSTLQMKKSDTVEKPDQFLLRGFNLPCLPSDFLSVIQSNSIRRVDVSENSIESLPLQLFQLPNVKILDVSANKLTDVPPPEQWECIKLTSLNLSRNSLTGVGTMSTWKYVYTYSIKPLIQATRRALHSISGSQIFQPLEQRSTDKDCLHHLRALADVKLASNQLQDVPYWVTRLPDLKSIDLRGNTSLISLPPQLVQFSKELFSINVDGLSLICPPMCEVRRGSIYICCYLNSQLRRATFYGHIQLMFVGRCAAGKTTLLRRLRRKKLSSVAAAKKKPNVSTIGIEMTTFTYKPNQFSVARPVTFNALDFAGQEDYYATHQSFFTQTAVYVGLIDLRLDPSAALSGLKPWLLSIQACAPGACVVVVGTHLDLVDPTTFSHDDFLAEIESRFFLNASETEAARHGMPHVIDFVCVSSVTGEGIQALKKRLYEVAFMVPFGECNYPFLRTPVPGCHIFIQECLQSRAAGMRQDGVAPVLTKTEFEELIRSHPKNDIVDERELEQATRFLHEIGTLLRYENATNELKDLYFIDLQFLSSAMACVVTSPERSLVKQGILDYGSLPILFKGLVPPSLHRHVMQLMEAFEVVVSLNKIHTLFLVPSMLPLDKPDRSFIGTNAVWRIYSLSYVPIGFWSRLTSRLVIFTQALGFVLTARDNSGGTRLEFTKGDGDERSSFLCWQRGFIKQFNDGSFVVVEEFKEDVSILVTVGGDPETRARNLVTIVQNVDTLIEEFYPGLSREPCRVTKEAACPECVRQSDGDGTLLAVCDSVKFFNVEELVEISKREDLVLCGGCKSEVAIEELVPDAALLDLPERLRLDTEKLQVDMTEGNCIGSGGFGKVYEAVYDDEKVALKVLNVASTGGGYQEMYREVREEVHILSRLSHPAVVELKGVCRRPLCIALELAPLGSLSSILKKSETELNSPVVQHVAMQIASALAYLHSLTIVYRDLKPHNILVWSLDLDKGVLVKLADYGIARFSSAAGLRQMKGTEAYMAPEMWKAGGKASYDDKVDIYSFGLVLFEIVTGLNAFWQFQCRWDMISAVSDGFQPSIDSAMKSKSSTDGWKRRKSQSGGNRSSTESEVPSSYRWHPLISSVKLPERSRSGLIESADDDSTVFTEELPSTEVPSLPTGDGRFDSGFRVGGGGGGNKKLTSSTIELEDAPFCQPYVQKVVNSCLSVNPADRPSAVELMGVLSIYPSMYTTSSPLQLDQLGLRIAAVQSETDSSNTLLLYGSRQISLLCSGDDDEGALHMRAVPFEEDQSSSKCSSLAVFADLLWIGISPYSVAVYSAPSLEVISSLPVPGLPLSFVALKPDGGSVAVGLDDGRLIQVTLEGRKTLRLVTERKLGSPVVSLLLADRRSLVAACGSSLVRLNVDSLTEIDRWPVEQKSLVSGAAISHMVPCSRGVWTCLVKGSDVKLWDVEKFGVYVHRLTEVGADDVDLYVTTLTCMDNTLWVGMNSGWISVYDVLTGASVARSNVYTFVDILAECRLLSSKSSILSLGKMKRNDGYGLKTVLAIWSIVH